MSRQDRLAVTHSRGNKGSMFEVGGSAPQRPAGASAHPHHHASRASPAGRSCARHSVQASGLATRGQDASRSCVVGAPGPGQHCQGAMHAGSPHLPPSPPLAPRRCTQSALQNPRRMVGNMRRSTQGLNPEDEASNMRGACAWGVPPPPRMEAACPADLLPPRIPFPPPGAAFCGIAVVVVLDTSWTRSVADAR